MECKGLFGEAMLLYVDLELGGEALTISILTILLASTPWKKAFLESRLTVVGMIRLGFGLLQTRIVHKSCSTLKNSSSMSKEYPLEFGSNFKLISKGLSFCQGFLC